MKNFKFYVYGKNINGEYENQRDLTLLNAIELFNELLIGSSDWKCDYIELGVIGKNTDHSLTSYFTNDDTYKIYENTFKGTEFENEKIITVNTVRVLKREIEGLNDRITIVEGLQNNLETYDSYELFNDWNWNSEKFEDYRLMVLNENGKIIIDLSNNEGQGTYLMTKNEFMGLNQYKFDTILSQILAYNWIEN